MKWRGAKKKLPAGRNSLQDFANFRDSAILRFINNRRRELPLLLLGVLQKRSELFDRDKSDLGVIEAKPVQVAPESRNKIGSRRHERRFSCLLSNRFRGQDRLKGFTRPGPVMDEKRGFTQRIFGSLRINQTVQGHVDTVADRRVLAGAQAVQQPAFLVGCRGDSRQIVFSPIRVMNMMS